MKTTVNLDTCADEPIRIPGSIQPHGVLLGVDEKTFEIVLASANAAEMLGVGDGEVHGRAVSDFLSSRAFRSLKRALRGDPRDVNPLGLELASGEDVHALLHRASGLLIVELEPTTADEARFVTGYRRLVRRFDRLRRAQSLEDTWRIAAEEVKAVTGYDRVMVYRFDSHDNGEVVEECREPELEPFLGLNYPASDIPPQARQLYIENPLRIIVDSSYEPVPLVPDVHPVSGEAIDLSDAVLRSVSPIHCEYLRNMGVGGSMSISLVTGDRLWGLIACHHRSPHHVSYSTRLVAEFLSHVVSARIVELDRLRTLSGKNRAFAIQSQLIAQMVASSRYEAGLAGGERDLADLIPCDGAAVVSAGEVTRIRDTPSSEQITELAEHLAGDSTIGVLSTDRLSTVYPPAESWAEQAAGAIAVPLSADGADYLFWFRGERIRTVRWAGNPNEPAEQSEGGRLSPRGSFDEWVEETRGSCDPWESWQIDVASDFRTALVASVIHQAAELERLNSRLVDASLEKDKFFATVSHELRNPLNAIVGWAHVARMGLEGDKLDEALATIERNAQAQSQLIDDLLDVSRAQGGRLKIETRPLDLSKVMRQAVDSLLPLSRSKGLSIETQYLAERSDIIGDPGRLQQVVWNLLSNAIKFSSDGDRIWMTLGRDESRLVIQVRDEGSGMMPDELETIFEPFKQAKSKHQAAGLGLGLSIVKNIVELHGGTVLASSEGLGLGSTFRVALPLAAVQVPEGVASRLEAEEEGDLAALTILVVEDQDDSAQMVAMLLRRAGARTEIAHNGAEALAALERGRFDAVISDLDMPEMDGFELIDRIRGEPPLADIPLVALTAYTRGQDRAKALRAGFRNHVAKPVDPNELVAVVASLLGRL